jgi:hypothetical protein
MPTLGSETIPMIPKMCHEESRLKHKATNIVETTNTTKQQRGKSAGMNES